MMVIMKSGHTREEFDGVMRRLEEVGLSGHPIEGAERTVIGVVVKKTLATSSRWMLFDSRIAVRSSVVA